MSFKYYLYGTGLESKQEYQLTENILLRPVKMQSDIRWLEKNSNFFCYDFIVLYTLADQISFELEINADTQEKAITIAADEGRQLLNLLYLIKNSNITWQFMSCYSASSNLLDRFMVSAWNISHAFAPAVLFWDNDIKTCVSLWPNFKKMMSNNAFNLACQTAWTYLRCPGPHMRMAVIWSGIEALLWEFKQETTFQISLRAAKILGNDALSRKKRVDDIKKLYTSRGNCVHGKYNQEKDLTLEKDITDSLLLLKELILFFTKRGSLMNKDEWLEFLCN